MESVEEVLSNQPFHCIFLIDYLRSSGYIDKNLYTDTCRKYRHIHTYSCVSSLFISFLCINLTNTKTVKEYFDRIMKVVNQIRLLGEELIEKRIVEKALVSLPEKYE